MMGGPFVCHSRLDKKRGRIIVAEAFLYAPDREKEVVLQRLEEALQTLQWNNPHTSHHSHYPHKSHKTPKITIQWTTK
jgi:hypothetical protein